MKIVISSNSRVVAYLFLAAVGVVFSASIVFAQSTTSNIRFEAEQGTNSGQAVVTSDSTASNSAHLAFTATAPPPTGLQFQALFETPEDFNNRFEFHVGNYCYFASSNPICWPENDPGNEFKDWIGDHNMACEGPTTQRTIHVENHNEMFWWCAPKGPESGHVMTALNTSGYTIIAFSPKQIMTDVKSICWDINLTELGGGKWTNVIVVPEAEYLRHPNPSQLRINQGEGPYRLDYTTPDFNSDNAPGDFNIQTTNDLAAGNSVWGLKNFRGTLMLFRNNDSLWQNGAELTTTDKAARFKHCIIENTNNSVTITRARPDGTTDSFNISGQQIPNGRVKVIFQDDNYDPPKRDGYNINNNTWHWDNIKIE